MAPIANHFRSGSSSSLGSSSDDHLPKTPCPATKRTRKRFTSTQLAMLEHLFHQTSHPSREERETLAQELDLEPKVVTIWFQNRRQTERKAAALNIAGAPAPAPAEPSSSSPAAVRPTPRSRPRTSTIPHPLSSPYAHRSSLHTTTPTPLAKRPTLEATARRTERRIAPPRTPSRRPDPNKSPWDNMPSSPLAPPSPPEREFVQFAALGRRSRHARSLEWACAAARLARRHGDADDDDDETDEEEEPHEAITPMGSLIEDGGSDGFWGARNATARRPTNKNPKDPESELMDAALLLCGLGRKLA
ncbi:hypothetical protein BC826DRAFT_1100523 [Russula brevipes]|nr:hypothetical protein BC826DRAFT_1100523 [Russula brevipes]